MSSVSTNADLFKRALIAAIVTAINDPAVLVTYGHPGLEVVDDMVGVGKVHATQAPATMSTRRPRQEVITAEVTISCFRGGGVEQEAIAGARAYQLLGLIEQSVRVTDTQVGGTVLWCFLTDHFSDGATDPVYIAEGRTIEIVATFTAEARIF